ncbi:hypothetical protein [Asanoa siamensis]|nr:hypothetical protein [Asanoa siamensis]
MALPIPTPSDVIGLTRAAVTVPARALRVIDDIEALVKRVGGIADRAEAFLERLDALADRAGVLIDGVDAAVTDAEAVLERTRALSAAATTQVEQVTRVVTATRILVEEAETVTVKANAVVDKAETTAGTADELLGVYAPALRRGAPMAHRFVEQLSDEEVDAAIKLIDELPRFTKHMDEDILPILATLDRVGPDIHELLEVTRDLRLAVKGIPGLRMLTKRGQDLG